MNSLFAERHILTEILPWEELSLANLYTEGYIEINQVVSGSGIHRILDQIIPCNQGDICVIYPHTPHSYEGDENGGPSVRRIAFDPDYFLSPEISSSESADFCYGVFCEGATVAYATLNQKTISEVEPLFIGIARETEAALADWETVVGSYLSALLITISRYIKGAIRKPSVNSAKERKMVLKAVRIINESYGLESTNLDSVAEKLFVSTSQLSRVFKHCMGKNFSEYLRELRMMHACRMLKETELNVAQIMSACGMRDAHSFYKSFRTYSKMTPSEYRNQFSDPSSLNTKGKCDMHITDRISFAVRSGNSDEVEGLVTQAILSGISPDTVLSGGLLNGMSYIGEKFKNNEAYVPEVLISARAMNAGLKALKPYLSCEHNGKLGRVCIGTVQGDLHDIGKNIVKMMLEGKGIEVIDLGVDVPAESFISTAIEQDCRIICCSALLTTTMGTMADIVKAAENAGIRNRVKIMVGGAPVTCDFCKAIGADYYTEDAATAAELAYEILKSRVS